MIKYFLENPARRLERKTNGASGYDLMADVSTSRQLDVGRRWSVPSGLYLEMPIGVEGQIRTRSGLARDHGVIVLNAPGTVDSDYRGEVCVTLINLGHQAYTILPGDRIAQIVFCPVFPHCADLLRENPVQWIGSFSDRYTPIRVDSRDELTVTIRGTSGHGSTGR